MAISRAQQNSTGVFGNVTTIPISFGVAPTNGNLLVLAYWSGTTLGSIASIVQTGATWVKAAQTINGGEECEIWYAPNVSGAGTLVTLNFSQEADTNHVFIAEYTGFTYPVFVDQNASNTGFGTTVSSGMTGTTTVATELWVSVLGTGGINPTLSLPSNGFNEVAQNGDSQTGAALEEFFATSTGVASTSADTLGTIATNSWTACIAALGVTIPPPPPPPCTQTPFLTANDYISELRNRFAEIAFTLWLPDFELINWLNLGIDDIVLKTLPPRNEAAPFNFTMTPGVYTYPLPANFYRMKEFGDSGGFYITGPNYFNVLLLEDKTDDLEDFISQSNQLFIPSYFWFWNKMIYVYPIPDIAYTAKMYYYRLPTTICSGTDTVDLDRPWVETLMKFVLWKALEKDKHPMAQYYRGEYESAVSTVYSESRIKVEKRSRYVHSHDYYSLDNR